MLRRKTEVKIIISTKIPLVYFRIVEFYGFIISPTNNLESSISVCLETLNEGTLFSSFHLTLFARDLFLD